MRMYDTIFLGDFIFYAFCTLVIFTYPLYLSTYGVFSLHCLYLDPPIVCAVTCILLYLCCISYLYNFPYFFTEFFCIYTLGMGQTC